MHGNRGSKGMACAFIGALCWGFSATCASYLMTSFAVDPFWLAFARLIIAGPIFLICAFVADRAHIAALVRNRRAFFACVGYALFGMALIQVSYLCTIQLTNAGIAMLMQETGIILVVIYVCACAKRLPRKREILSAALALFGVWAIATQGAPGVIAIGKDALIWGLVSGFALAMYNILPAQLLDVYGPLAVNGIGMTVAAVILGPIARPASTYVPLPPEGWAGFAAIVAVGTIAAYFFYLVGVRDAGPERASLIAVVEPLSGIVLSALWLKTPITPADAIGGAAIIAMMILVSLKSPDEKRRCESTPPSRQADSPDAER